MMRNFKNINESGRSMIEMLGVLAIIGVLSVGGIAGYSKAMQKYRINKTIEQITLIAGNVRTFFASQRDYEGVRCSCSDVQMDNVCNGQSDNDGCPIIKKAKILPDEMVTFIDVSSKPIHSITNPFGGELSLDTYSKSKYDDKRAFSILLSDIPEEACIELLTQDWSNANLSFAFSNGPMIVFSTTPASVDNVIKACTDINHIHFVFDADINCYKTGVCDSDFSESTYY